MNTLISRRRILLCGIATPSPATNRLSPSLTMRTQFLSGRSILLLLANGVLAQAPENHSSATAKPAPASPSPTPVDPYSVSFEWSKYLAYQLTCDHISISEDDRFVLQSCCRARNQTVVATSLDLSPCLTNDNGNLTVSEQPGGAGGSCRRCELTKTIFSCQCYTGEGHKDLSWSQVDLVRVHPASRTSMSFVVPGLALPDCHFDYQCLSTNVPCFASRLSM